METVYVASANKLFHDYKLRFLDLSRGKRAALLQDQRAFTFRMDYKAYMRRAGYASQVTTKAYVDNESCLRSQWGIAYVGREWRLGRETVMPR